MTTDPSNIALEAKWQVWYQDVFDRECPRSVEIAGRGLVKGLTELWARHLFETVQASGQKGFSRFNLWWEEQEQSIAVVGDWTGHIRLRKWVFGSKRQARKGYVRDGDEKLLARVAATHANLILAGQTSEAILAAAEASSSRKDFEARLSSLESLHDNV